MMKLPIYISLYMENKKCQPTHQALRISVSGSSHPGSFLHNRCPTGPDVQVDGPPFHPVQCWGESWAPAMTELHILKPCIQI